MFLVVAVVVEDCGAAKVEDEGDNQLIDGLSDDHFPHRGRDQRRRLGFRLTVENAAGRRIGGQGESGKGIHDQVHP